MEQVFNPNNQFNKQGYDNKNNSKILPAKIAKRNAKIFYYGNIIAVLIPFPFFIFWFGASMFVYAMYRHHPNKRVGYHTQRAAYYYYALSGLLVPVLTFASGDFFFQYWWLLWGVCALVIIPISIIEILKINKEQWTETEYQSK